MFPGSACWGASVKLPSTAVFDEEMFAFLLVCQTVGIASHLLQTTSIFLGSIATHVLRLDPASKLLTCPEHQSTKTSVDRHFPQTRPRNSENSEYISITHLRLCFRPTHSLHLPTSFWHRIASQNLLVPFCPPVRRRIFLVVSPPPHVENSFSSANITPRLVMCTSVSMTLVLPSLTQWMQRMLHLFCACFEVAGHDPQPTPPPLCFSVSR